MAIEKLGNNDEQQFTRNSNKFVKFESIDVYRQSINPTKVYTCNPDEEKEVEDILARKVGDKYVIVKYKGSNLLSSVETAIMKYTEMLESLTIGKCEELMKSI